MTQLQPEDPRLSDFLRRYRPAPPASQGDLENYLLARIEQDVQQQSKGVFWILSSAVVAGMIMGWGVYRYSSTLQMTASSPELENFLLESWNTRSLETTYFENSPYSTSDLLLLNSPAPHYIVSVPR